MRNVLVMLTALLVALSASVAVSEDACKCVTAECAAGLRPAKPHKVSYEEACMVAGSIACAAVAAKSKDFKKAMAACQATKTVACIAACK